MVRFSGAPVQDVAPTRKIHQPSQLAQTRQQYEEALRDAVLERQEALVVEMEPEDKVLTIRNRVKRAADQLGIGDIAIRRRGDRIIAYRQDAPDEVSAGASIGS